MNIKILSWNIANRQEPWRELGRSDADIALLQEVGRVPDDLADNIRIATATGFADCPYDRWPLVVQLSERVKVDWFKPIGLLDRAALDEVAVSDPSTIAIARVSPHAGEPFIVASVYARWIKSHVSTKSNWGVGYSDASAHRAISDLSNLIGHVNPSKHRLLVAGDFNMIYGATEDNKLALPARERTIVDRFDALGLEFLGPQYPAGRQADPIPQGLSSDTGNLPTYYTSRQDPATAQNQLDYVFASRGFHRQISVKALNSAEDWGPSDHCRLLIEVDLG